MNSTGYKKLPIEGVDIFYIEAGDATKPCILLLHGFPSSSFMFQSLIDHLQDRYYLVAPTYPGFGLSGMPSVKDFDYSFDHLAIVMEKFVDALGIKKASFLMHDYGGPVGFRIMSRRPGLLDAMMVMNANAYQEGLTASSQPLFDYWKNPTEQNEAALGQLLTRAGTEFQYYDGVSDRTVINPAAIYTDQFFWSGKAIKKSN